MKRAALIAVGTELLHYGRAETNTAWIAERLERRGVEVAVRTTVVDDIAAVAAAVRAALETAGLVIMTGGLGPTEDDRTREAVCRALNLALVRDPGKEDELRRRTGAYNVPWSELQARQADRPEGAVWVPNGLGSADGWRVDREGATVVALPGVPSEMRAMVETGLAAWAGASGPPAMRTTLRVAGMGEGSVDALLRDLYAAPEVDVTTLGAADGVDVRVRSSDPGRLEEVRAAIAARLGAHLFAEDERRLVEVVGDLLGKHGESLAVAESCTGGMLAAEATAVAGSSGWFRGGWIVYHNDLKDRWAGIDAGLLAREGAVSEPVARCLAEAVRRESGATWAVGVTGIAGPGGGSEEKPVGLVHVALAGAGGTRHWKTRQPGDRARVRRRTVAFALDRLRRELAEIHG